MQAVGGSVLALVLLISTAQQLNGSQMTDTLKDIVRQDQVSALNLTVESARDLLRYSIMVLSVLCAASLVLGVFVLRRHRAARVGLTVLGIVVGLVCVLAGPVGWVGTLYISVSLFLLWTRPARAWFGDPVAPRGGPGMPPPGSLPPESPPPGSLPPGSHPPPGSPPGGSAPPGSPPAGSPPPGSWPPYVGPPTGPRRDVDGRLPPPEPPPDPEDDQGPDDPR